MGQILSKINTFFEALPDRLRQHKWWVLVIFILATGFLCFGIKNVVIDESLANYFHKDDPVKQAYDKFRTIFGGDEYVYIVYRAKDNDIFSNPSLTALKNLHNDLANYRLYLDPGEPSALDHIDEVKSLINVKYMEARDNTLFSRNFIGDRIPENSRQTEQLRKKALNHPDYPQMYLSRNCSYGGIFIRTDFNAETPPLFKVDQKEPGLEMGFDSDEEISFEEHDAIETISDEKMIQDVAQTEIREYAIFMKELRRVLANPEYTAVLEFFPVGNPALMDFFSTAVFEDVGRLMSFVLLIIIIILWILFRSFSAVIWPVLIVLFTILWILGLVGWINIPMTAMLQVIIFLSLSVGIADAVHILSGYLFFRNKNLDHRQALRAVMKKSGLACLLTSLTTGIGLFSLVLVPLKPISIFGVFASIAVVFAFVFTIVLLPLMLDLWSPVSKRKQFAKDHFVLKIIKKIEAVGISNATAIISVFLVAGVLMFFGLMQLKVDSNFVDIIKKGLPLRDAYTIVDDHMGGTGNMEVMVDFKRENALKDPEVLFAMASLQDFMEKDESNRVVKTMSLVNVVKDSFKALNDDAPDKYIIPSDPAVLKQVLFMFENANPKDRTRLVTDDYSKARIGLNSINVGSIEAMQIMKNIQAFIDERFEGLKQTYPDLNVTLTGNMALLAIMLDYIAWAQIKSFGLALVVISIILFVVLGSSKAGLVALLPNLFPILTAFGLMGYFNIPLDADTLLVAPIIIGLAVDDTIHFMTHFRLEMEKSKNIASAAVKSIRESGQAISFTSLILSAGFLVFILSFHNGLSRFGIFASIAIMTALLSDLFFLPALCKALNVNFNQQKKG
jgi:predicted RND superfamily exporter protein